jgi:hypothetical protein
MEGSLLAQLGLLKIEIRHKWLTAPGGVERLLERIIEGFIASNVSPLYDFVNERHRDPHHKRQLRTSFVQYPVFARRYYRFHRFLMPSVIEQLYLNASDLSSDAVSGGKKDGRACRRNRSSTSAEWLTRSLLKLAARTLAALVTPSSEQGRAAISSAGVDADAC